MSGICFMRGGRVLSKSVAEMDVCSVSSGVSPDIRTPTPDPCERGARQPPHLSSTRWIASSCPSVLDSQGPRSPLTYLLTYLEPTAQPSPDISSCLQLPALSSTLDSQASWPPSTYLFTYSLITYLLTYSLTSLLDSQASWPPSPQLPRRDPSHVVRGNMRRLSVSRPHCSLCRPCSLCSPAPSCSPCSPAPFTYLLTCLLTYLLTYFA